MPRPQYDQNCCLVRNRSGVTTTDAICAARTSPTPVELLGYRVLVRLRDDLLVRAVARLAERIVLLEQELGECTSNPIYFSIGVLLRECGSVRQRNAASRARRAPAFTPPTDSEPTREPGAALASRREAIDLELQAT